MRFCQLWTSRSIHRAHTHLEKLVSCWYLWIGFKGLYVPISGSCLYSRVTTRTPRGFSFSDFQCFRQSKPRDSKGTVPSPSANWMPSSSEILHNRETRVSSLLDIVFAYVDYMLEPFKFSINTIWLVMTHSNLSQPPFQDYCQNSLSVKVSLSWPGLAYRTTIEI